VESLVAAVLSSVGINPAHPLGPGEFARRRWGDECLRLVSPERLLGRRGCALRVGGRWQIEVSCALDRCGRVFAIAHEAAEILYEEVVGQPATEARCDELAGVLLLPAPALARELASRQTPAGVAARYGVSVQLVEARLRACASPQPGVRTRRGSGVSVVVAVA
jgi:hypothetical protein